MKAVLILSGGMDSTTLLYNMLAAGHEVAALSFNYGQKHSKELQCAMTTCAKLGIQHEVVDFTSSMKTLIGGSALTSITQDVPEGHYADDNMKATVVPNRNMIMLALATGFAINIGAECVAYGAHAGDHAIYPDCRPEFYHTMDTVMRLCHFTPVKLYAPFMTITKNDIAMIGKELGVPYEDTWTCYKGQAEPCGVCGACVERAEAFAFAEMADPLVVKA